MGLYNKVPDEKGKQENPFSNKKPMYVERGGPLVMRPASNKKEIKIGQKPHTVKNPKARDEYVSEEFKQMKKNKRYKKRNYDIYDIDAVNNTCKDLEIDG